MPGLNRCLSDAENTSEKTVKIHVLQVESTLHAGLTVTFDWSSCLMQALRTLACGSRVLGQARAGLEAVLQHLCVHSRDSCSLSAGTIRHHLHMQRASIHHILKILLLLAALQCTESHSSEEHLQLHVKARVQQRSRTMSRAEYDCPCVTRDSTTVSGSDTSGECMTDGCRNAMRCAKLRSHNGPVVCLEQQDCERTCHVCRRKPTQMW